MTSVAILGPGGVGGFVAGALDRAGIPVTLVARESTAELIAREGIRVESVRLGTDFTAHPRAVARLGEPVDFLVVAPKSTALAASLERIAAEPRVVIPLLNGLDDLPVLRERFGRDRVAAALVMAEWDDAHETLGSSMQRDIAAGREPELDAIPGSVLRAAARHGIECPTIERLMDQVSRRIPAPTR